MKDTTTLLVLMLAGLFTGIVAAVAYSEPPPAASALDNPSQPVIERQVEPCSQVSPG